MLSFTLFMCFLGCTQTELPEKEVLPSKKEDPPEAKKEASPVVAPPASSARFVSTTVSIVRDEKFAEEGTLREGQETIPLRPEEAEPEAPEVDDTPEPEKGAVQEPPKDDEILLLIAWL